MIDPIKDNFIQPLSIKEILDELKFFKDDCYRALSILKNEDLELRLKRQRISCFVNWPVFNYEAVAYMCQ